MKQYEKIKKDIMECESAMEMAGYLNGLNVAVLVYCQQNYPDEVWVTKRGETEISIYGMECFLEKEIKD